MGVEITVDSILATVSNRILALRSFQRQLEQEKFRFAYNHASEADKIILNQILKSVDTQALKTWITKLGNDKLTYMSYRALRKKAQEESIPYWSRMDRDELITALEKLNK